MKDVSKRKTERLHRPTSVKLMISGRPFTVHNLSDGGIGFMSDGPLPFKLNDRLSMTIELQGRLLEMEGHVMHLSPMSELRCNLGPDEDRYLYGVAFEAREGGGREVIAQFVDSRLEETGG